MKKNALFFIGFLLILVITFYIYPRLPDEIPIHWNAAGEPDGYGHPSFIFFFPALYLVGWGIVPLCARIDPKKKNYAKFAGVQTILQTFLCLLSFAILLLTLLEIYYPDTIDTSYFTYIIFALMFLVLGNSMPKIKANYMIGIRTSWTLADEQVWYKTHRFSGKVWVIGGLLMLLCILLPAAFRLPICVLVVTIVVITPILYSYLCFRRLHKK